MEVFNQHSLKNKKMLVICPARGRPEILKTMIKSFEENTSPDTGLIVCLDDDDDQIREYRSVINPHAYTISKRRTITQIFNEVSKELKFEFYSATNDDFVYQTRSWDRRLMEVIEKNGGWGISYGDDMFQRQNIPTSWVVSRNIVEALGWMQLPSLTHLFGDNVTKVIGQGLGRLHYVGKVIIEHRHHIARKAKFDEIYSRTNSQEMYRVDDMAFKNWFKTQATRDIGRIVAKMHKEAGFKATLSLCMICADSEKPETLARCLKSVKGWVDEINIVFNYKGFPKPWKLKKLQEVLEQFGKLDSDASKSSRNASLSHDMASKCRCTLKYEKWTDFSDMRNKSLKMATSEFFAWLDADDVLEVPWNFKDIIFKHPDMDFFRCWILSYNDIKGTEHILHNRLLRNYKGFEFRNKVHEDINFSCNEKNARGVTTDIKIHHFGNVKLKDWKRKNMRNYKLTLKEINKLTAHSLTYFAIANELMIMGTQKSYIEAIGWIDKYLGKVEEGDKDPLIPKMWVLRGLCAMSCGQLYPAQTNFMKAWNMNKHPEAGVNLAECFIQQGQWDKAVDLLEIMVSMDDFQIGNIPCDMKTIEVLMMHKLGLAYEMKLQNAQAFMKSASKEDKEKMRPQIRLFSDKAEKYYRTCLALKPDILIVGDRLCNLLRKKGKANDANMITVNMVNIFPDYAAGWQNLAALELQSNRYRTARVFLKETLRVNPKNPTAIHNLRMINRALKGK